MASWSFSGSKSSYSAEWGDSWDLFCFYRAFVHYRYLDYSFFSLSYKWLFYFINSR
jgi:hypothetical protein